MSVTIIFEEIQLLYLSGYLRGPFPKKLRKKLLVLLSGPSCTLQRTSLFAVNFLFSIFNKLNPKLLELTKNLTLTLKGSGATGSSGFAPNRNRSILNKIKNKKMNAKNFIEVFRI